jgi:hypothetical protein
VSDHKEVPASDPDSRHSARVRGYIALLSVGIYMVVGAALMLLAIFGLSGVEDSLRILQAWGSFSSLVVGAAIGFYFGAKS